MLLRAKQLQFTLTRCLRPSSANQLRFFGTESGPNRRQSKLRPSFLTKNKAEEKSEWWIVDGEMHEVGDHVPPRERFVIPRDNIPNLRRKKLREQFMRRTRLVLKESEHEPWCKRYTELYEELRENWERLYWDDGYSKKIAQDHANYESAEDDDQDFNPYRSRRIDFVKDHDFARNRQGDSWDNGSQIRDKFEYDRARRMRDKAFAPMDGLPSMDSSDSSSRSQHPFDAKRYFAD